MLASFIWMNTLAVSFKPEPGTVGTLLWNGESINFTVNSVDPWPNSKFLGSMEVTFAHPVQGMTTKLLKYSLPVPQHSG
jgi:hypothetical protein